VSISVFGIRHHGSGSAKSLRKALIELQPDIVLVEGPPDAEAVLPLCMHEEMRPPVALLIYAPDQPKRAVYYPFTTFSPEWQALHYSFEQGIPARFMDLPQAIQFARQMEKEQKQARAKEVPEQQLDRPAAAERIDTAEVVPQAQEAEQQPDQQQKVREDPLAIVIMKRGGNSRLSSARILLACSLVSLRQWRCCVRISLPLMTRRHCARHTCVRAFVPRRKRAISASR